MNHDLFQSITPDVFSQPTRQRYSRVKTGCLTCRRRKKKCDEVRPKCKGCSRNKLECSWPKFGPQEAESRSSKGSPTGSVDSEDHDTTASVSTATQVATISRNDTIRWSPVLQAFMAPERAATLTPRSMSLLQHYVTNTSSLMVSTHSKQNPFMSEILPVAYVDDLLMHGILAVSGAHLYYENKSDLEVQTAALSHYSAMVRGVRMAFQEPVPDEAMTLRTLLALVMLSYFEVSSYN